MGKTKTRQRTFLSTFAVLTIAVIALEMIIIVLGYSYLTKLF